MGVVWYGMVWYGTSQLMSDAPLLADNDNDNDNGGEGDTVTRASVWAARGTRRRQRVGIEAQGNVRAGMALARPPSPAQPSRNAQCETLGPRRANLSPATRIAVRATS